MIILKDIYKEYHSISFSIKQFPFKKKNILALKDINLSVNRGDIMALIGPNGAGKTTLLKILATLITFDKGEGKIYGYDIKKEANKIKKILGIVNTNDRSFYWRLTVRQNLDFFGALYNISKPHRLDIIDELLTKFKLKEVSDQPFMTLSSGQRQKVCLARAFLPNPKVLLLDEPTTNLDPLSAQDFIDLIKSQILSEKSLTLIWCTHNLEEAQRICNRYCIMNKGQIVQQGDISTKINLSDIFKNILN